MLKLYLIRHGQTPGNRLSRYIGTTDEPLSDEGREFLKNSRNPFSGKTASHYRRAFGM